MPAGRAATACSAASERWSAPKARTRKRYRSTRNAMRTAQSRTANVISTYSAVLKTSSTPPTLMRSRSESTTSATRRPFTKVPFVLCRSYSV